MWMICTGVLLVSGGLIWWTRAYEKTYLQSIDKKVHPLWRIYPAALFFVDKFQLCRQLEKRYSIEKAVRALEVEKTKEDAEREYLAKKIANMFAVFLMVQVLVLVLDLSASVQGDWKEENILYRSGQDQIIPLEVTVSDSENDSIHQETVEVPLSAYYGRQQESEELMNQVYEVVEKGLLGENTNKEEITKDLVFLTQIPETDLTLQWHTQEESILDDQGHLKNDQLKEITPIRIYAQVSSPSYAKKYGSDQLVGTYETTVQVLPKTQAQYQEWLQQFKGELEQRDEKTVAKETLNLPKEQAGKQLRYYSVQENEAPKLWGFGLLICGLLYVVMDEQTKDRMKKRERQMRMDYPEIINKFSLLMSAGMTVEAAWNRMTEDYEKVKGVQGRRYAYEEMKLTNRELKLGGSEQQAIEAFGMRTGMVEYLKFTSLLGQNLKKGSKNLCQMLELEAVEAFEDRKAMALKLGEEAGTKQLLPMFLMLFLVILIIMIPAYWSMQI